MKKKKSEYDAFTKLTDTLLAVSHETVRAKLNEEKQAKKRKKSKKSSASREAV
jgi:hypothetical protein